MSITVLKDNGDGTYLGADENGALYDGATSTYGFDELTRNVVSDDGTTVEYQDLAGSMVVAQGSVEKDNYTDGPHQKAYREDGTEKVFTVTDWTAR